MTSDTDMKLKDVCSKIGSGATPRGGKEAYKEIGLSLIRSQNVLDYRFTSDGLAFIDETQAKALDNVSVQSGDVLLNITGDSVARACIVDDRYLPARVNQHVAIIRGKPDIVLQSYILYYLQMKKPELLQIASGGATRNALTKGMIEEMVVFIPSIEKQKKIVAILDNIQERININQEINDNLYQQLQSVYQQRFTSFPNDGDDGILSDICTYSQRRITVASLTTENYYSTENMLPSKAGAISASSLPTIVQTTGCAPGDVLISNIRPYFKKIMYCRSECGCSTDVLCFVPKEPNLSPFLFSTLYDDHFFDYMVAGSKGTKMPRGDKQQIMAYPIMIPSSSQLKRFNALAEPILAQVEIGVQENNRLAALRDALLPKLMSGEIDASNIAV